MFFVFNLKMSNCLIMIATIVEFCMPSVDIRACLVVNS